jgi:hypothetical protein
VKCWLKRSLAIGIIMAWAKIHAEDGAAYEGRWGVALSAGVDTYALTELNQDLAEADFPAVQSYGDQIGLTLKYRVANNWMAAMEANYLMPFGGQGTLNGQPVLDVNIPEYLVEAMYIFPNSGKGWEPHVGVAAGVIALEEEDMLPTSRSALLAGQTSTISGSGFDGNVFVGLENHFISGDRTGLFPGGISLCWDLGYREADLSPIYATSNGSINVVKNADNSNLAMDYSGFYTKISMVFWVY